MEDNSDLVGRESSTIKVYQSIFEMSLKWLTLSYLF
jgi:hypothetical protein